MIAKQVKGKSFRGVLNYLHEKEGSRIIGGNMAGDNPRVMSAEFAVSRQLNPRLSKAVYHSSLSLPKTEHLDDDTWSAIAEEYLGGMGFGESQYVVYRHSDKDHDHVHIVASRIRITDGTTVSDSWDYVRSEKLVRELEHKYELTPTISSKQKLQCGQTTGEQRLIDRTGESSVRKELTSAIDRQTDRAVSMPELINRLKEQGVDARISITRTGLIKGISYKYGDIAFSGTHLGRAYTFPGLQKHKQVTYDHNLHHLQLIEASNTEPAQEKPRQAAEQAEAERLEEEEIRQRQEKQRQIEKALNEQSQRSLIIAPILRDYIKELKKTEFETQNYRVCWQRETGTLYLYRKGESEPILKTDYHNQEFIPASFVCSENQPRLTSVDVENWRKNQLQLRQAIEQREREQEREVRQKQRRRGLSL